MVLFLDLTRLATCILRSTPTGIERVEYAYASEVLGNMPHIEVVPTITTPLFSGAITRDLIMRIMSKVETSWGLTKAPSSDAVYRQVRTYLEAPPSHDPDMIRRFGLQKSRNPIPPGMIFPVRELASAPSRLRQALESMKSRGQSGVYVHTSHTQLERPQRFDWTRSYGVKSVFMVHDTIPIDYPEFCSPGAAKRHMGRLQTVRDIGSAILVNSEFTAQSIRRQPVFASAGRDVRIEHVPLAVDGWFASREKLEPPRAAVPYALCVGTIEPRKNLIFLLSVWRRLSEVMGEKCPRLVIVGRRGWENENVVDLLERSQQIKPHLVEVADLGDSGLASLMAGATVLVAPSMVEGFGLPVLEAGSLGVPVLASDIPAHREAALGRAIFIDPIDGAGWLEALRKVFGDGVDTLAWNPPAARKALTWPQHVQRAVEVVMSVAPPTSERAAAPSAAPM